jgi:hypothetical protein
MKVDVMPRSDGGAVERGRLVVPLAQGGFDLLVDAVSDGLNDLGFDDISFRVDGNRDHHVAYQVARERGAIDRRVRIDGWIGNVNFMAGDGSVNEGAKRRASMGVAISSLGVGNKLRGLWSRRLSLWWRDWARLTGWKEQFGRAGRRAGAGLGRNVYQLVTMSAVSEGKPGGAEVDHAGSVKDDYSEEREVRT